jgi:predicted phage terminase large subunit-like protein
MSDKRTDVLELASESLAAYGSAVYPGFECADHIRILVRALEAVESGKIKRLVLVLPPRHGKSLLCSQVFPSWYLGRHPERNIIAASYGESLAVDFGRQVRSFLTSPEHQAIFPKCRLSADVQAQNRLATVRGGFYYALGRGGALTGRGADLLVIDDLLKDYEEAQSETIRKSTWDWLTHVGLTRLSPRGCLVMVGTRWHESDPMAKMISEVGGCTVIHLPAISEKGAALWPSRFPLSVLQGIRGAIGERAWASLYMGKPSAAEGTIFKRSWLQTYREAPGKFERLVQSWDIASKTGASNDYSVCTTWGANQSGYYLLGLWRDRVEFPELKRHFGELAQHWGPDCILCEDASSAIPLVQELRLSTAYPVIPVKATKSKELRAQSVSPSFEAGKVYFPESAPWLTDFVDELVSFPSSAHDDQVDSTTQALNYLRDRGTILGVVEYLKEIFSGSRQHPDAAPPPPPEPVVAAVKTTPASPPADMKPACVQCGSNRFVVSSGDAYHCNVHHHTFYRPGAEPEFLVAGFRGGKPAIYLSRRGQ